MIISFMFFIFPLNGPSASSFKLVTAADHFIASAGSEVNLFAMYEAIHVSPLPLRQINFFGLNVSSKYSPPA